jgi:hypothetical protein
MGYNGTKKNPADLARDKRVASTTGEQTRKTLIQTHIIFIFSPGRVEILFPKCSSFLTALLPIKGLKMKKPSSAAERRERRSS